MLVVLWAATSTGCDFLTRSPVTALLLGLVSSALVAAGIADLRTGLIPRALVVPAILAAALLDVYAHGVVAGLIVSALVSALWIPFGMRLISKRLAGGGDAKVMWANWLVMMAFPGVYPIILIVAWVSLFAAVSAVRRRVFRKTHYRAGLALALTANASWLLGLLFMRF